MAGEGAARRETLAPGLYLLSAPIGAARDITLRALDVLRLADMVVAEDTRTARRLMTIHGIGLNGRPLSSYNDVNGPRRRPALMTRLRRGESLCYIPDAGTPLIADPGFRLVEEAQEEGIAVIPVPGPTAAIAALTVSGLPTDRFLFAGFAATTSSRRQRQLAELASVPATLVFYESPRRLAGLLDDMALILGEERRVAICRELTKQHEEIVAGTTGELAGRFRGEGVRGEVVVVVGGCDQVAPDAGEARDRMVELLSTMSLRDAVRQLAAETGLSRSRAYALALDMSADGADDDQG